MTSMRRKNNNKIPTSYAGTVVTMEGVARSLRWKVWQCHYDGRCGTVVMMEGVAWSLRWKVWHSCYDGRCGTVVMMEGVAQPL